jgi:alpha-L-fucosidase 2
MAQLAWQHYRYTMDEKILREIAMPLLIGAFEGYWAMAEESRYGDGRTVLSLPVSVSPEFKGADMDAWGKNASFQLAAFHLVAKILPQAAKVLNQAIDPRWQKVTESLPPYSTIKGALNAERWGNNSTFIALWEGTDLEDSHRHHAHLGGIYPFGTINPQAPQHKQIVNSTLNRWVTQGSGAWSGWCVPWASILNARCGRTEAAVSWLHWWRENFVNEGGGISHNANTIGVSIFGSPTYYKMPPDFKNNEIMQLDAGQGALSAVLELLVQERQDAIYIIPDVPLGWQTASFENIKTEGAFSVSAKVENGKTVEVKVKANYGGKLRLAHGLGEKYTLNGAESSGAILEKDCANGETLVLKRL